MLQAHHLKISSNALLTPVEMHIAFNQIGSVSDRPFWAQRRFKIYQFTARYPQKNKGPMVINYRQDVE
jgi:hypothetical protein